MLSQPNVPSTRYNNIFSIYVKSARIKKTVPITKYEYNSEILLLFLINTFFEKESIFEEKETKALQSPNN